MAPSLRQRLFNFKLTPEAKASKNQASDQGTPPVVNAIDHFRIASSQDLTSAPPLPEHLTLPREPEKARCSPSKSLLERYKIRAPAALSPGPSVTAEKPPKSRLKTAKSNEDLNYKRPLPGLSVTDEKPPKSRLKKAKSAEDLNNYKRPFFRSVSEPAITIPEPVKSGPTIRRIGGINFEMMTPGSSLTAEQHRGKSAEAPRAARSLTVNQSDDHLSRRTTRSESRRKERNDSMVAEDAETDYDAPKTKKDFESKMAISDNEGERRRATLRKKKESSKPKIPRTLRSTITGGSSKKDKKTKSRRGETQQYDNSSSSDDDDNNNGPASSTLPGLTLRPRPPEDRHLRPDIQPIKVTPPLADSAELPGLLWTSPLSANSRPDSPWEWNKRWTCCRCAGKTIVEQGVCSRLTCGHVRCGVRCRVVKDCKMFA